MGVFSPQIGATWPAAEQIDEALPNCRGSQSLRSGCGTEGIRALGANLCTVRAWFARLAGVSPKTHA